SHMERCIWLFTLHVAPEHSMKRILIATLLTSFGMAASAADSYTIDPDHTHATFSFEHLGFSTFHGKIPSRSGSITLDRAPQTGKVDVVFDLAAVTTGVKKFDEHLREKDFFEVDKHPTATFKADEM